MASKTGREKYKRQKKGTKEVRREQVPSREETLKKRGFQTPGNILEAESVVSLGSTEGNITGRRNKQIIKTNRL